MKHLAVGVVSALTTAGACLAQLETTLPDPFYATHEGNSNFTLPWNAGANGGRVQFCHDSSLFTATGMTGPIRITGLRYRADALANTFAGGTYPSVVVDLSTCVFDYLAVSNTFVNNHGPDQTNVYSGPVTVLAFTGGSAPAPVCVDLQFTTPFVYDPALGGDLLIEFVVNAGWTGAGPGQVDHVGPSGSPAPMSSRVWISGSGAPTSPTGSSFSPTLNYCPVCELVYEPAAGLWPNFVATSSTTGTTPLAVQFEDRSVTDDPNGIAVWQWDLDGDAVVDSTVQNPTFTYTACGSYDVTLTVIDGQNGMQSTTKTAFVVTDQVEASFTYTIATGNIVMFTDTTTPAATQWAWDFDGDGVTDSTLQDPVWAVPRCCVAHQVSLTASRLCGPADMVTVGISFAPLSLTTQLTGGTGYFGSGSGNLFDLDVLNPDGVTICAVTNCPYTDGTLPLGTPVQCEVYVTDAAGGYTANHDNAAVWRLAATGAGIYQGGNSGSPVPITMGLDRAVYLPPGSYGVAIYMIGTGIAYRVGGASASNTDLVITAGGAKYAPFNAAISSPRAWSGTLHYDTAQGCSSAGYGFFGAGCPGSLGISRLVPTSQPILGGTLSVTIDALPTSAAFMVIGFSNTVSAFGPLPFDVSPYGAPGCSGRVSTDAVLFMTGSNNTIVWNLAIPNVASLAGQTMYQQALALDPGLNRLGASLSDAAGIYIGN